ncbi:MAG TPA: hypothetical protein VLG67_00380 [Candidatus Saccharimonadales bacterium]|nr:hypothetical protein [Candidatus Saccharimonadales bacterium]
MTAHLSIKKIKTNSEKNLRIIVALLLIASIFYPFLYPTQANAGLASSTFVRLDRVKASTPTTGLVCTTTSSDALTEADVQVTFPTGFTLGAFGTFTVATTNIPSGATAWPGIATATNVTGQVVTFPSTALAPTTQYCFRWTNSAAVTTGTAGNDKTGSVVTRTSTPTNIDTGNYAVSIISDDQISVTASVPLTFSFALSGNSMPLGTLSTGSTTSSTSQTATIGTNAASGWIAWVNGANGTTSNGALHSTLANADISAPGSSTDNTPTDLASTTGYVLDVDVTTDGGGTGTVTQGANFGAEFNGTNATSGGSVSTLLQPIAASNGTTDGDILTLTARAKVAATQPAATDYTDTLTVVAAGRF